MKGKLVLIFALLLAACSPNFSNSHRLYSGVPAKSESVGYVELGSAFMLTRADWFAEKLNIQYDSIYSKLEVITDSVIFDEIKKKWEASIVSRETREKFSRETLKMDKTIF